MLELRKRCGNVGGSLKTRLIHLRRVGIERLTCSQHLTPSQRSYGAQIEGKGAVGWLSPMVYNRIVNVENCAPDELTLVLDV